MQPRYYGEGFVDLCQARALFVRVVVLYLQPFKGIDIVADIIS